LQNNPTKSMIPLLNCELKTAHETVIDEEKHDVQLEISETSGLIWITKRLCFLARNDCTKRDKCAVGMMKG
jgi:predicted transcriptional regulator